MDVNKASLKPKSEKPPICFEIEINDNSGKIYNVSPTNILSTIEDRFFHSASDLSTNCKSSTNTDIDQGKQPQKMKLNNEGKQSDNQTKKQSENQLEKRPERHSVKQSEKQLDKHSKKLSKYSEKESDKQLEKSTGNSGKDGKKFFLRFRIKELSQKPIDRDLRRFKTKYNSSMGNIVRDWLSLIYCILILRMNLIKFIINNLPERSEEDAHLHKQILLESKVMFDMIRNAQTSSQEKFLYLWTELEKLIFNRKVFKSALQVIQTNDSNKHWKAAVAKLTQLENDFNKATKEVEEIEQSKLDLETSSEQTMLHLEKLAESRDAEYTRLVEKISELKKREVQMRGRILINMKSYKDLKSKKQKLMAVEENMGKLKIRQSELAEEYCSKIQGLKNEIEEMEKQIREEKELKKKIRATLEGFGDYSEKETITTPGEQ